MYTKKQINTILERATFREVRKTAIQICNQLITVNRSRGKKKRFINSLEGSNKNKWIIVNTFLFDNKAWLLWKIDERVRWRVIK